MDLEQKRVIALGFFDGVHLGHAALLKTARQMADQLHCPATVLTFDLHPTTLVTGKPMPLICSSADRAALVQRLYGIDEVLFSHFDRQMMEMPWEAYVREYLHRQLRAVHLVCGRDYRFGWRGEGNPQRLQQVCAQLGIGCTVVDEVTLHGRKVSSTHIRQLLQDGSLELANEFLGHPHCISGTVIHGRQLGRALGTPTANILLDEYVLPPAFGVYATRVFIGSRSYLAVTNVGVRPTVDSGNQVTVEPWILDFDGDLYGQTIRVEFHKFLRSEQKFDSLDALRTAILKNAEETRTFFGE